MHGTAKSIDLFLTGTLNSCCIKLQIYIPFSSFPSSFFFFYIACLAKINLVLFPTHPSPISFILVAPDWHTLASWLRLLNSGLLSSKVPCVAGEEVKGPHIHADCLCLVTEAGCCVPLPQCPVYSSMSACWNPHCCGRDLVSGGAGGGLGFWLSLSHLCTKVTLVAH